MLLVSPQVWHALSQYPRLQSFNLSTSHISKHSHCQCFPEVMVFQLILWFLEGNIALWPLSGKAWMARKLPGDSLSTT